MESLSMHNVKSQLDGRVIAISGDLNRFLISGQDTEGRYSQWEAIMPPGGGPPVHVHSREEEAIYVLSGEVTARIGAETVTLRSGMSARLPIGTAHGFRNDSASEARILFTAAPAGIENFFFEAGIEVADGAAPPGVFNPEQRQRVLETATHYGIQFLGEKA